MYLTRNTQWETRNKQYETRNTKHAIHCLAKVSTSYLCTELSCRTLTLMGYQALLWAMVGPISWAAKSVNAANKTLKWKTQWSKLIKLLFLYIIYLISFMRQYKESLNHEKRQSDRCHVNKQWHVLCSIYLWTHHSSVGGKLLADTLK